MFGYVRPLRGELKVFEYERFKAAYCGLCNALRDKYGYRARFLLNYDYMLPLLLLSNDEPQETAKRWCPARPFGGRRACVNGKYFEYVADLTVILTYWKLRDNKQDNTLLKSIPARALLILYAGAYKKAKKRLGTFDAVAELRLSQLKELEDAGTESLDIPADKFALILAETAQAADNPDLRRILEQLLYHTGRWVYIIDAYADLKEDFKAGRYNPVARRFGLEDAEPSDEIKNEIRITLSHSLHMAASAFELLEHGAWTSVTGNIIYAGMPYVTDRVLDNDWDNKRRKPNEGSL